MHRKKYFVFYFIICLGILGVTAVQLFPASANPLAPQTVGAFGDASPPLSRVQDVSVIMRGNRSSGSSAISGNGRYVAFTSEASNLVENDTNNEEDIFVYDLETGETTRVSVSTDGVQANEGTGGWPPAISADGRYVAFISYASNLVVDDSNDKLDAFVHDRETGETVRVSVASDGTEANDHTFDVALSANGRFVTFQSSASNLVATDTTAGEDIFVHDRETGETTLVSVASNGEQADRPSAAPAISADGRYVTFSSEATNLVEEDEWIFTHYDVFLHDRETAQTIHISATLDGFDDAGDCVGTSISNDGRFITIVSEADGIVEDDSNETYDIFIHDRKIGENQLVPIAPNGLQSQGYIFQTVISGNGRYIAFVYDGDDLISEDTNDVRDVYVYDRELNQTTRVSVAPDGTQATNFYGSVGPSLSEDGNYIAFTSGANNFVEDDYRYDDVFIHNQETKELTWVSAGLPTVTGNLWSADPVISDNGRFVAFTSEADNLVTDDTNLDNDIFVRDLQKRITTRVSIGTDGDEGNSWSTLSALSANGQFVAFYSYASNLVPNDTNGEGDVFVHDRQEDTTERVSVASGGVQSNGWSHYPTISEDGRYIAFISEATNLVMDDENEIKDIFVYDRQEQETTRISVATDGSESNGEAERHAMSADGRFVVFDSEADNLVPGDTNEAKDIFLHDRQSGQTSRISMAADGSQGNDDSAYPVISGNGRFVVYWSGADNLVANDDAYWDVFIYDRESEQTTYIPVSANTPDNYWNLYWRLDTSPDGRFITFASDIPNLVADDQNAAYDAFLYDQETEMLTRISHSASNEPSGAPVVAADGRMIAFNSYADDLIEGDANLTGDIFLFDRLTEQTTAVSLNWKEVASFSNWLPTISIASSNK